MAQTEDSAFDQKFDAMVQELGKPLEVEDWATLDWKPGLVAVIHGRIVFRPNGGDVIHCIGIGQMMTSPPPVDDSAPAS